MISEIMERYVPLVQKAITLIIGEPHKNMLFVYVMSMLNHVTELFKRRKKKNLWKKFGEKLFAYTAFISLGNILDQLMMDHVTNLKGTGQLLVCLYIVIREIGIMRDYLRVSHGIEIPFLNQRISDFSVVLDGKKPDKEAVIEKEIADLRNKLKALEERTKGEGPA